MFALAATGGIGAAAVPQTPAQGGPAWSVVSQTKLPDFTSEIGIDPSGQVYVPTFSPRTRFRPASSHIVLVDGATGKINKSIDTPKMLAPANGSMAFDPANESMFVPVYGSSSVAVVDGASRTLAGTIAQPKSMPWGSAYDPSNGIVYVTDGNDNNWLPQGQVYAIDTSTQKVVATIPVSNSAADPGVDPALGKLFVTVEQSPSGSGEVEVIDTQTNTVESTIQVGDSARGIAVDTQSHRAYVLDDNGITILDTQTDAVVGTVALPSRTNTDIALDSSDGQVFVSGPNDIYQVDGSAGQLVNTIPVAGAQSLFGITVNPANHHVFVDALVGTQGHTQNELIQLAPSA
jgi:YVTN family beta-propeller protein